MKKVVKNKAVGQPHQGIPDISVEVAQSIVGISSKEGIKLNLTRILFFIEGAPLPFHRKVCYRPVCHSGTVGTDNISQTLHA
jgi:hypothetical protein